MSEGDSIRLLVPIPHRGTGRDVVDQRMLMALLHKAFGGRQVQITTTSRILLAGFPEPLKIPPETDLFERLASDDDLPPASGRAA